MIRSVLAYLLLVSAAHAATDLTTLSFAQLAAMQRACNQPEGRQTACVLGKCLPIGEYVDPKCNQVDQLIERLRPLQPPPVLSPVINGLPTPGDNALWLHQMFGE